MPDIDVIRELSGQLRRPRFDQLVAVSRRRRRRAALVATVAVAVVVLAVSVTATGLSGRRHAQEPVQQPPPSRAETSATSEVWTPQRIRAEGALRDTLPPNEFGITADQYVACSQGSDCEAGPVEDMEVALEVSQQGRSALYDVRGREARVETFDQDSLLVLDSERLGTRDSLRYRLLGADGTAVRLRLVDDPAPAVPGPGVFRNDFSGWSIGMAGSESLYVVDEEAGTVQPMDAPADVRYWGPNLGEFLWGVTDDCRVFWATGGRFTQRRLDCSDALDFTYLDQDWFPAGWLKPGRMVVGEQTDPGNRTYVHVSLDNGATWQRIGVGADENVADALQQLG